MNYPPYPNDPNDPHSQPTKSGQYPQWSQPGQPQQFPQPLSSTQYAGPQQPLLPTQYAGPQQAVPSAYSTPPPPAVPERDPYNMTVQNPYALPNPYATPLQAPPPPRSHRQVWRRIFIVLGSLSGFTITSFGVIGLFVTLQSTTSSIISSFIIAGVIICIGILIFCKSATSMIGRWFAGFSAVIAAILFLYSIVTSSIPSNFIGATVILLLAGVLFWTTRNRRW